MAFTKRGRGLVAAMESEQDALPVNDTADLVDPNPGNVLTVDKKPEPIIFPEGAESTETEIIEVINADKALEEIEGQLDNAEDVVQQIGQVSDIVERANENGGLEPSGAELLTQTLESLYERAGIATGPGIRHVPSLESFGGVDRRIKSGQHALEDMKQNLKTIWDNILKAMRVFGEKVKTFFENVFNASTQVTARVKASQEAANAFTPTNNTAKINNARLAKALAIGNSVPGNLAQSLQDIQKYGQYAFTTVNAFQADAGKKFLELLKTATSMSQEDLTQKLKDICIELNKIGSVSAILPESIESGENFITEASKVYLGNAKFVITVPRFNGVDITVASAGLQKMTATVQREDVQVNEDISTLTKAQIIAALPLVDAINNDIIKYKTQRAAVDNIKNQMNAAIQNLASAAASLTDSPEDKIKGGTLETMKLMLRPMIQGLDQIPRLYVGYAIGVMKATLDLTELSMKATTATGNAPAQLPNAGAAAPATESHGIATEGLTGALKTIFIPFYAIYAGHKLQEVRKQLAIAEKDLARLQGANEAEKAAKLQAEITEVKEALKRSEAAAARAPAAA